MTKELLYPNFNPTHINTETDSDVLSLENKRENFNFYFGRTWQYWIGIKPHPKDLEANHRLKRAFQQANKVRECVQRLKRTLIGYKPSWNIEDNQGRVLQGNTVDAFNNLISRWLDLQYRRVTSRETRYMNPLHKATRDMVVCGEGYLRLWQPQRYANSNDPIYRVALHSPDFDAIEYKYDEDGLLEQIEYRYESETAFFTETQRVNYDTGLTEFTYTNEKGDSVFNEDGSPIDFAVDLACNYSIQKISGQYMITESVKRLQNQLNYILTLMSRNLEYAGFRERVMLNAQPPGEWDTNSIGQQEFKPLNSLNMGPGNINYLQGYPTFDSEGNITGYSNPSAVYSEPIDSSNFIETVSFIIRLIYEECGQGHILGNDQQISGISRQQMRVDFQSALLDYKNNVEQGIAATLEVAAMLMGVGFPTDVNVVVNLNLNEADPAADRLNGIIQAFNAGLYSRQTAMHKIGIKDPRAEISLIDKELEADLASNEDPGIESIEDVPTVRGQRSEVRGKY